MATNPNIYDLYPLSTPGGEPIPLEIVQLIGLIKQSFTNVAANGVTIPACDFIYVYSDQDCIVKLGGVVVAPADGEHKTDTFIVPANTVLTIDHKQNTTFGVIRVTTNGTLWVQTVNKYQDINKNVLFISGS